MQHLKIIKAHYLAFSWVWISDTCGTCMRRLTLPRGRSCSKTFVWSEWLFLSLECLVQTMFSCAGLHWLLLSAEGPVAVVHSTVWVLYIHYYPTIHFFHIWLSALFFQALSLLLWSVLTLCSRGTAASCGLLCISPILHLSAVALVWSEQTIIFEAVLMGSCFSSQCLWLPFLARRSELCTALTFDSSPMF